VVLSPLVKSAAHGNDPNWGRILSSVGATGVALALERLSIRVQGVEVYRGAPGRFDPGEVSRKMDAEELLVAIDLGVGTGVGQAWGCDLSAEYVKINADYHT
jgi:glutamate N-acetyltransferase / amino-acid N-acetyltransferase